MSIFAVIVKRTYDIICRCVRILVAALLVFRLGDGDVGFAQQTNSFAVEGAIVDGRDRMPLPFAAVSVEQSGSVVKGVASDANGHFRLGLKSGSYVLVVS